MQLTPLDPVLISAAGITARHRRSARPAHSCVRDHCRTVRRWRLDCAKPRKNGDQTRRLAMLILVSSQRQCRRAQGQDGAARHCGRGRGNNHAHYRRRRQTRHPCPRILPARAGHADLEALESAPDGRVLYIADMENNAVIVIARLLRTEALPAPRPAATDYPSLGSRPPKGHRGTSACHEHASFPPREGRAGT
jgi:hypothetical protein